MSREVCIVFGATGGIGSDLTRRLVERAAHVLAVARTEAPLADLAGALEAAYCVADARDPENVEACFDVAHDRFGPVTGVALCVGSILLQPAHLTTDAEWRGVLDQNLTTAFNVVRSAARHMMREGGAIVLVSSAAARHGLPNHEAIAAAKAGVIGLTLSAAATYAPKKIRVNCVAPGLVRTPLAGRITGNEASLRASTSMHALGRIGEPGDVASAIAWFLSPEQSWVTGQVLGIDGGLGSVTSR